MELTILLAAGTMLLATGTMLVTTVFILLAVAVLWPELTNLLEVHGPIWSSPCFLLDVLNEQN